MVHADAPAAVHCRVPPGVPAMERHKADIKYGYEQTELGAVVAGRGEFAIGRYLSRP